ncbi:MAG TPA: [FeFe] hydrogenase H-cluster radical SAM maturase HydG [Anaerohalosphaeraceae bacterium]|nr:[FeFe] hydrogenase H-cluster radical SAM maturase HydG [Phycisphaerae bacterium]HOK95178.1 [FeFe] hydrogenase H-cluster radical SAM maturase HydG [Anaerohalosphaeraceae bacterium]HOL31779.1 [FeFe] hydrogenase H-cluster radical SAM maturase HydG [Anaerohalosphaeraceae bacterium]HOM76796.1 [FeFe] hydrogenase H-cluster radical SAM maturase HydG [Anaerohalosphaeraceae bacterium]HPC64381.1 [FeFe] hydrogenase H-cluster radical SAM maturase HydG [Anaerohalosphaeraceae bacterium]
MADKTASIIKDEAIETTLKQTSSILDASAVYDILSKASQAKGLDFYEVAVLSNISDPELLGELFNTAKRVKETIYGRRLVLFAPLYISNMCKNECLYCAFRAKNKAIKRRALTQEEIAQEVKILENQGHKRILLVAGESYPKQGFQYILDAIETVYTTKSGKGEIRRVNVNIAPLTVDEFRQLKAANIGTYQLFQETYHRQTYKSVHIGGKKTDYDWRLEAIDRAMEAGIDDVGIGVLFGLCDWRFELLALMQHIRHLEERFGVGPHTISVPRLEPATGSDMASHPPKPVSDIDFRKIVAILRLAVPYTGIIMSTRETPKMRRETFALGVSQISAGSRTNPGGYTEGQDVLNEAQFCLGDHRSLDEVIYDAASLGYIPSFCTGCYRLGRTGQDFMDLAKPGLIKEHCDPNALSTFLEYLLDYGSDKTRHLGETLIANVLAEMDPVPRQRSEAMLAKVRQGRRDVFC